MSAIVRARTLRRFWFEGAKGAHTMPLAILALGLLGNGPKMIVQSS